VDNNVQIAFDGFWVVGRVYAFHLDLTGVWIALVSDALVCYFLARKRWFTDKWAAIEV
jgi:Na+-driven multidrug efflux pump